MSLIEYLIHINGCNISTININHDTITSHNILSVTQHTFYSIGFSWPVLLLTKYMLQENFKSELSWNSKETDYNKRNFQNTWTIYICWRYAFLYWDLWNESKHLFGCLWFFPCCLLNMSSQTNWFSTYADIKLLSSTFSIIFITRLNQLSWYPGSCLAAFLINLQIFKIYLLTD